MKDYEKGIKKQVSELKFLIHDLRVTKILHEILHYQASLNMDLQIFHVEYGLDAQLDQHEDIFKNLKRKSKKLNWAYKRYADSVVNYKAGQEILESGNSYIDQVVEVAEIILYKLWDRFEKDILALPEQARSVQNQEQYRNYVRWICGVYNRIASFRLEKGESRLKQAFDISDIVHRMVTEVIVGYMAEKTNARVKIHLNRMESAIIIGNIPRFRRLLFNLIMNAADAMRDRSVGTINVDTIVDERYVLLIVTDEGKGMDKSMIQRLLSEKQTLDGALHSLGFVFVKQTVQQLGAILSIDSVPGQWTMVTVRIPISEEQQNNDADVGLDTKVSPQNFQPGELLEIDCSYKEKKAPKKEHVLAAKHSVNAGKTNLAEPTRDAVTLTNSSDSKDALNNDNEIDNNQTGQASIGEQNTKTDVLGKQSETAKIESKQVGTDERQYGQIIVSDYRQSEADYPGCIFFMSVNEDMKIDFFSHKPYEKYWGITHEDLNPMFFESIIRGRLEENEKHEVELVLKSPINARNYFEFKNLDMDTFSQQLFCDLIRKELIRVSYKLIQTGMPPEMPLHISSTEKFFPDAHALFSHDPVPLGEVSALWSPS